MKLASLFLIQTVNYYHLQLQKKQLKQKLQNIDQNKLNQVKAKVQSRLATLKK
ncbi:hypothetical protein JCM19232_2846 [Vibrio ishigakensis]|uniref:Uncharacterized protein n=1 Tax=Vibrio ishigakensis TaxID=1481914 RepID=A0A0B8PSH8_9VIBR|nr:hypothetical protein JCM19232_2846 [Vibrio ishigakensis]